MTDQEIQKANQEKFKAGLLAQMKTISRRSALEGVLFLMGLHDISINEIEKAQKQVKLSKGK